MKYKLLKELPFMKVGEVFGTGSWVSGGFGVDQGNSPHGAHNGVKVFEPQENLLLEKILSDKNWIEKVPINSYEVLDLFKLDEIDRNTTLKLLKEMLT